MAISMRYGTQSDALASSEPSITAGDKEGVARIGGLVIQWGIESITPVANTPTSSAVTFQQAYAENPTVIVSMASTVPYTTVRAVSAANITTSGFDAYVTRTNTTVTSVMWLAIGQA